MVVCKDHKASHPSLSISDKTEGGKAVKVVNQPLQRRKPCAAENEVAKGLPCSKGRQKRGALFALRAPRGVTHPFPAKYGNVSGSTIDLMMISG